MVPPSEAKEYMGHRPLPPTKVPPPASARGGTQSINGHEGFLPDAHELTTTSNLEVTRGGSRDAQAEKGGFQASRPRASVSEAPKSLNATDSRRWWGAREVGGGVAGRGARRPPEAVLRQGWS